MAADDFVTQQWLDATAKATRTIGVDAAGVPTSAAPVVRVEGITRYATAGTRTVGAGKKSYSVQVVTAASAASPTLGGVALPAGWSGEFTAPDNDTLTGLSLVTVGVDDVIVTAV